MMQFLENKSILLSRLNNGRFLSQSEYNRVENIIASVQDDGDKGLRKFTLEFDGISLKNIQVPEKILLENSVLKNKDLHEAITQAAENIRLFHEKQMPSGFHLTQPDGTHVTFNWRPIGRVGIYIPGGNYPLLSTVLMNVIPAQVAGVKEIIVCTPPQKNGSPDPAILNVCELLGINEIYQVGGAQAIAAMALGTQSIPKVDKITGPGNRYVNAAKYLLSNRVGIDMIAGPTELIVVADETANPNFIAADLISQAEHDVDAMTLLLCPDQTIINNTMNKIECLLKQTDTKMMAEKSLRNNGFILKTESINECISISNQIAPEHLSLHLNNPEKVQHQFIAGVIFLGQQTPVAWGDYWAGPNHTLPTSGTATFRGLLTVFDFLVPFSTIEANISRENKGHVISMANGEGLSGHALSVKTRGMNHD